ncbi:hypothetical protein K0U00_42225, partial [Paenibacillus sepulcri]|nr:hypothetical protein [Paenibacillus sepulcri]
RPAAERLEAVLTADMEARVKDRVLRNRPSMRDGEWQWLWFELKRYFLMCAIMRGVPMYSEKVDEVWHEMLMFTREYEQFCIQLSGGFIHHAPHGDGAGPEQGERAWFDWIYGELFVQTPVSSQLWGTFYRTPLSPQRMEALEQLSVDELRGHYFNVKAAEKFPDLSAAVDYLIQRGQELAADARSGTGNPYDRYETGRGAQWSDPLMMTGALSGALFMSSMLPPDQFANEMDAAHRKEQGGSASSCGSNSYVCDSDSSGSGGHDGGGSSCGSGSDGGGS